MCHRILIIINGVRKKKLIRVSSVYVKDLVWKCEWISGDCGLYREKKKSLPALRKEFQMVRMESSHCFFFKKNRAPMSRNLVIGVGIDWYSYLLYMDQFIHGLFMLGPI